MFFLKRSFSELDFLKSGNEFFGPGDNQVKAGELVSWCMCGGGGGVGWGRCGFGEAGTLEAPIQTLVAFLPTLKASSRNVSIPRSDSLPRVSLGPNQTSPLGGAPLMWLLLLFS